MCDIINLQLIYENILKSTEEDYKGLHQAPTKENGSPLYNLLPTYPDDIYSNKAAQYYGHYGQNNPMDLQTISIIHWAKNKPNAPITIYRAVPKLLTNQEKISNLQKQKAYILQHGKIPPNVNTTLQKSDYYEFLHNQINKLQNLPEINIPKFSINKGDWVTINKNYAKEHGESTLNGNYKIISKTVKTKDIFTDGNSIHEWGYDPS